MKKTFLLLFAQAAMAGVLAVAADATATLSGALQASYEAEKAKDYPKAAEPLETLGAAANSEYIVQLRLGWLRYCDKKYDDSIARYKKAVQLAPAAVEPLLGLMMAQMAAGKNDDAQRTGLSVLARDSANYTATSRLAWLTYLERDYRKAAFLYRKLATLYPTDTEMLLGLGYSLKLSGDAKEGDACFQKVLLLSPGNAKAQEGLKLVVAAPAAAGKGRGRR